MQELEERFILDPDSAQFSFFHFELESWELEVAVCDLKFACSSSVIWNAKSPGNRRRLRLNASLNRPVLTP